MKVASLYANLGWAVVPLHVVRPDGGCSCGHVVEPGAVCECGNPKCERKHGPNSIAKHPRLGAWEREATDDPDRVAEWVKRFPDSNIGVATGAASGMFVLDEDPDKGGRESLAKLEATHGPLPRTVRQITGSGGSHYVFRMPDHPVTNSASKVGRGLDIRGDGGQIVVAPSRSGKGQYRWAPDCAPWELEPAEAPAWLLQEIRRVAVPAGAPATASADRGYWPPPIESEINEARLALNQHGPAIDGQGGGLHTVHAAAILTHDFAFTEDEAWPVFLEWNETCQGPWDRDELRVMLGRGLKYGKMPYGWRRPLGAVVAVRKMLMDWQAKGGDVFDFLDRVRPLTAAILDPARRDLVAKELAAATGVGVRALALPKPVSTPPPPVAAGEIQVTTELHKMADASIRAITPRVFARNGVLCEVVSAERTFIHDVEPPRILDLMSACATYVRNDPEKGPTTQTPPPAVASILHARRAHHGVRILEAVTTAPVFLADGTILRDRGYNAAARLYLEPTVIVDVPDQPSRDAARAAVGLFRDLLCDFTFASPADFASWLAALLSPLVKAATGNAPAPMTCVSASLPGSGKTLLVDVLAQIVTGGMAEVRPYNPRDSSEWGKKLTSFVKAASPVSVFDNVNGPIGDEGLDRLITSSTWSDRQLGTGDAPPLPNVSTWMATGNNIEPIGDTVRRVLMVRLEVMAERPQERTGFKRPLATGYALDHRDTFLSAALTILRAYHVAGRPSQGLPSWGSFGTWSELVRGALVWAGCEDPFLTQRRASSELNESEHEAHDFWLGVVADCPGGRPADLVQLANSRDARGTLGLRDDLSTHKLRHFLPRFVDKPRGGKRIRREQDGRGVATYFVEAIRT